MWRLWQIWAMPEDFAPCAAPTHNIFLMPAPPRREAKKRCPVHPWIQVYFWRVGHDNEIDKCSETSQLQCETKKMTFMSFNLIQHLWIRITWCLVDVLNQLSNNQVEHWCFQHPLLDGTCPKDVLCYISLYYRGPNTNDRDHLVEQLHAVWQTCPYKEIQATFVTRWSTSKGRSSAQTWQPVQISCLK